MKTFRFDYVTWFGTSSFVLRRTNELTQPQEDGILVSVECHMLEEKPKKWREKYECFLPFPIDESLLQEVIARGMKLLGGTIPAREIKRDVRTVFQELVPSPDQRRGPGSS